MRVASSTLIGSASVRVKAGAEAMSSCRAATTSSAPSTIADTDDAHIPARTSGPDCHLLSRETLVERAKE